MRDFSDSPPVRLFPGIPSPRGRRRRGAAAVAIDSGVLEVTAENGEHLPLVRDILRTTPTKCISQLFEPRGAAAMLKAGGPRVLREDVDPAWK